MDDYTNGGILTACLICQKVKKDEKWVIDMELLKEYNDKLKVSHGICPECAKKRYPDFVSALA